MTDIEKEETAVREPVPWWRGPTWLISCGTTAILVWGLVFDQLVRTGRWALDTAYDPLSFPLEDLRARYTEAHVAVVGGDLYRMHFPTSRPIDADTYPPVTAYLFYPFHAIGLHATETVWTVGTFVLLAVIVAVALNRWCHVDAAMAWFVSGVALAPGLIVAMYPFHAMLVLGQTGVVIMFLAFVDLFVVPHRFRGLLIGVAVAIKLLPIIFVVWFLVRRDVGSIARTIASFGVLTLVAVALSPHYSAQYWLHIVPSGTDVQLAVNPMRLAVTHALWFHGVGTVLNQSIRGMLGRPPFDWFGTFPWLVVDVVVLLVGVVAGAGLVRQGREAAAFVTISLITILVSPVGWNHYWVFVGLVPFVAVAEWRRDKALAVASIVLAVSTCANLGGIQEATFPGTAGIFVFVVRNLYVLGGVVFLAVALRSSRRRTEEHDAAVATLSPATP